MRMSVEIAAAQEIARGYGLACDEAVRLAGGSNALVHLRPAPVVARVMTGTAHLHDDVEQWLSREVDVAGFAGDAVVPPTGLMPPGPHEHDGLWMTFWQYVEHDPGAPEPRAVGEALKRLHTALAGYPGDLPPLSGIRDWLARLAPAQRHELEALNPTVFESSLPVQPIHGDASLSNLLRTDRGLLWNDFEDVCLGPVAWDLGGLMTGRSAAYNDELLAGYGDPSVVGLEPFLEAHALYEAIWRA